MNEQVPDWNNAPEWANYCATDMNGQMWWDEIEPSISCSEWRVNEGGRYERADLNVIDWRETLTTRPVDSYSTIKAEIVIGDTTGASVGEIWQDGDALFINSDGALTNVEPEGGDE